MLALFVSYLYLMYFVFICYAYLYNVLHFILNKSINQYNDNNLTCLCKIREKLTEFFFDKKGLRRL